MESRNRDHDDVLHPAPLILTFDEIGALTASAHPVLELVGGKGANLGIMTRAGLPVPPGFCVTTEAYRRIAPGDLHTAAEGLAGRGREAILRAPVPDEVRDAVLQAAATLTGPVAVRSSATAEDLPDASFAGQQDTFLNVIGEEAVLDAVRRCWASLWTDRAVAYRDSHEIDHASVRLSVVIQQMIDAAVAGVMFTANPVTGRRRQTVIDASPGLGEAVVSGAVNPDHFVVTGDAIVDRRIGDKRVAVRSLPGGGTQHVETAAADAACLTDAQVLRLAELGRRVEDHYGAPQDTEWALDAAGALWLTQARPITTLYPLPGPGADPAAEARVYFCFSLAQGLHRPITPLGLSAFRVLASGAAGLYGLEVRDPLAGPQVQAGTPALVTPGQRLYVDLTTAMRSRVGRALVPRVFDIMEARSAVVMRSLFDDPRFSPVHGSPLRFARRIGAILIRYGVPYKIVEGIARPAKARERMREVISRVRARLVVPPGDHTIEQRLAYVERALLHEGFPALPRIVPGALGGLAMFGLARALLGEHAKPGDLLTVLRGLPYNVTTEMDLGLWEIASRLRAAGVTPERLLERPLPRVAQDGLAEFLERFGHRAVAEIDLGLPRWSEDPAHLIGVLANYLRLEDPDLAPDRMFERGAREADAMIRELGARVGGLRGRVVRFALGRTRELVGIREMPKFMIITVFGAVREQLMAIGADLARQGLIDDAGDVSFLTLAELQAPQDADLRARVTERRAVYEREMRRRHIPRVLLTDGTEPEAVAGAVEAGDGLRGSSASAGVVTGTARVVLDPVGAHLEPGEILVAPSTDPGWTPLFLTAGGLVMEMGGANSHGAVVAREYGIPAVVGVAGATEHITTGQKITVDGTAGIVRLD